MIDLASGMRDHEMLMIEPTSAMSDHENHEIHATEKGIVDMTICVTTSPREIEILIALLSPVMVLVMLLVTLLLMLLIPIITLVVRHWRMTVVGPPLRR